MKPWKFCCAAVLAALLWSFSGCGPVTEPPAQTTGFTQPTRETETAPPAAVETTLETVAPEDLEQEAEALRSAQAALPQLPSVEAPGILVESGGGAVIDYSNTAAGYVMVRYEKETEKRLKVQVKGPNSTYTYNLTPGLWTAFPLTDENGGYQILVYENVSGNKYATVLSLHIQVALEDEFAPFLHANQYVNYDDAPKTVAKAAELTGGITDTLEKVAAVYDFVIAALTYDKEQAKTVQSGYLPQLDAVLEKGSGICFDYAALMAGMLRSQGIPTKLVVGYAGQVYHAWISVWTAETGWVDGVIFFDGAAWQRMDPTFASSAGASREIMAYIGDGSNYTAKYFY